MSLYRPLKIHLLQVVGVEHSLKAMRNPHMSHERSTYEADLALASKLVKAGDEHAKFTRGVIAYIELDAQIGWFVEWTTYRIGLEVLSTSSTMHIDLKGMKGPELAEAKQANLPNVVYRQTAMVSYQTLRRIYLQRRNHRHPDWQIFCAAVRGFPYFESLIVPEESK